MEPVAEPEAEDAKVAPAALPPNPAAGGIVGLERKMAQRRAG